MSHAAFELQFSLLKFIFRVFSVRHRFKVYFWGGFLAIVWTGQWRETIGEEDREGLWAPVVTEATGGKKTANITLLLSAQMAIKWDSSRL